MSFRVRYSPGARDDLKRLYGFLVKRDVAAAELDLDAIRRATDVLRDFRFTSRKVDEAKPHQQSTVFTLLELNKSQNEIHRITGFDRNGPLPDAANFTEPRFTERWSCDENALSGRRPATPPTASVRFFRILRRSLRWRLAESADDYSSGSGAR
ncbi:plasmid stabilization system protein ParE [Paraburkholderia sp. WC7.3g]|uniref:type II toxin-antitoxin system RelE/ParE family toxin n=1 Tax=Paraburkholderia sp. WC7.3g TaxID=2991070 RepID=UPI003D263F34